MTKILEQINQFIWGIPALVLIVGVGIYLTVGTGGVQLRLLPKAIRHFFAGFATNRADAVSARRATCTALAATVGTGNLVGVAGAIAIGGPGAIFWMWVCGLLGMATKFAEATLAVRYCFCSPTGERLAGPMYMIRAGMGARFGWLGAVYCFFGVVASFGVGNATQVNAMITGLESALTALGGAPLTQLRLPLGLLLACLVAGMLSGGAKRIGVIAERLVPFAAGGYILLACGVLVVCRAAIPNAVRSIFVGAFTPGAVTGGVLCSAFQGLRVGASRGVFTNEAGMGTAAIAHGAAEVAHPAQQGLMGIMEVFLDTILICTLTALVILCSGIPVPYGTDAGAVLTSLAFSSVYGSWVSIPIAVFLCCFALATLLGWGFYGIRCAEYLFGSGAWKPFALLQSLMVIFGAISGTGTVWLLAEIVNGLMAIPNLLALLWLSPELFKLTKHFIISSR